MLDATGTSLESIKHYEDLPYLPVSLFKDLTLRSIPENDIVKTMTSSGTTGQKVSKIFLDRDTSANQTKALAKIVASLIGNKRVPMVIIDSPNVIKDRNMFSARGAGILGFSYFGSKRIYALDENMDLNIDGLKVFLEEHKEEKIFLFGFTFMIWQHFYKKLAESSYRPNLSNAVLVHGGGWKKLVSEAVDPAQFKQCLNDVCGISVKNVHDYYGMVEQTGSIYIECEHGHLHTSNFSDVIIRNPHDFSINPKGKPGVIEVVSVLPQSYPGHVLLTEDEGVIHGEDDCPCGRKGTYFSVYGRIKNAEIRGCSDTYATKYDTRSSLEYIIGNEAIVNGMPTLATFQPFSKRIIEFLDNLSKQVMKNGRNYSDVMTFGFWCRKAAVLAEKAKYSNLANRLGRGVVFHIAPSNVPVNFAYSFVVGLLAGNANIVRLPSKEFPQAKIICDCIRELTETIYLDLTPYICMVKYPATKEITDRFSAICQTRVIWGGDVTIANIRTSTIPPRSNEITFADRYSFAVIDADEFLSSTDQDKLIQNFYNDTYFSDQNACTAPRLIVWLGKQKTLAQDMFWEKVLNYTKIHYQTSPVQTIGKISALLKEATIIDNIKATVNQPFLTRIKLFNLSANLVEHYYNSGFFFEYDAESLNEITPLATTKTQTISYYGLSSDQIKKFITEQKPKGIDRFVPIGKTMDFSLVWDGIDLIQNLSRTISIV